MISKNGELYIVATPIGNIKDITLRAIETLQNVDIVACEDTRETLKILNEYGIKKKLVSYHEHNKYDKLDDIIKYLQDGLDVALVTDQGTPIISDPGFELVKRVKEEEIKVTSIPGACAVINALVLSGIDAREFVFVGFMPTKQKNINEKLEALKNEQRSIVFYISVHKLINNLKSLIQYFGEDRKASLIREMTKMYEEVYNGSLKNILDEFSHRENKGEFVLVIEGKSEQEIIKEQQDKYKNLGLKEHFEILSKKYNDEKLAMKELSKIRNIDKREIYKLLKTK